MPTYEYRCKDCDHELEAVQGFHDDPLTECPQCGGPLRKKFGSVGISFKGSGFYKNDSRSSRATSGSSTPSGDSSSSSGSGDSSSGSGDSSAASGSSDSSASGSGGSDTATKSTTAAAS